MVIFAGVMAVTAYVILNLEFPASGSCSCARSTRSCEQRAVDAVSGASEGAAPSGAV